LRIIIYTLMMLIAKFTSPKNYFSECPVQGSYDSNDI
jgi:hypothetical protein